MIWQWLKDRLTHLPEQTVIPAPVIGEPLLDPEPEWGGDLHDHFLWSPVVGREPEWDERFPKKPYIAPDKPVQVTESKPIVDDTGYDLRIVTPSDEIVHKCDEILFDPNGRNDVEYMEAWRNASVATLRGTDEITTNVTEIRTGPSLAMQLEELRTSLRGISKRMARLSL